MSFIEKREVEMVFDNAEFEKKIGETISGMDKLDKSLSSFNNYDLSVLNGSFAGFVQNGIAGAVQGVNALNEKFSVWGVAARRIIEEVTTDLFHKFKNIANALILEPITTGMQEYETQINAIQTILTNTSSKGTTLDQVNEALNELNKYADLTIYNFTEMTRNIGTFTAAGIDLDTSVASIKGIANLAAASGSTSQQASTAMYQLSQALASGTVKLMDWNSVVNAGMGGELFQNALKKTAREYGINVDKMIEENGSFRESLSEGWLSAEVLTTTLRKFTTEYYENAEGAAAAGTAIKDNSREVAAAYDVLAGKYGNGQERIDALTAAGLDYAVVQEMVNTLVAGGTIEAEQYATAVGQLSQEDYEQAKMMEEAATKVKTVSQLWDTMKEAVQSGWTQTWTYIIGDFEEARTMLTNISNVANDLINEFSDSRNVPLKGWHDLGGRDDLIEGLTNLVNALGSALKQVQVAFTDVFPSATAEDLLKITSGFKNLTSQLNFTDKFLTNLHDTAEGIFSIVDLGLNLISALGRTIAPVLGLIDPLGDGFFAVTGGLGRWITSLNKTVKANDTFFNTFQNVLGIIQNGFGTVFNRGILLLQQRYPEMYAGLVNFGETVYDVIWGSGTLEEAISKTYIALTPTIKKLISFKDAVVQTFSTKESAIAFLKNLYESIKGFGTNLYSTIADQELFKTTVGGLMDFMESECPGIINAVSSAYTKFGGAFRNTITTIYGVLSGTNPCKEFYAKFNEFFTALEIRADVFARRIGLGPFIDAFKENPESLASWGQFADTLSLGLTNLFDSLPEDSGIRKFVDGITKVLDAAGYNFDITPLDNLKNAAQGVFDACKGLWTDLGLPDIEELTLADVVTALNKVLTEFIDIRLPLLVTNMQTVKANLTSAISSFSGLASTVWNGLITIGGTVLGGLAGIISNFNLDESIATIKKIFGVGFLAELLLIVDNIRHFTGALKEIKELIENLGKSFKFAAIGLMFVGIGAMFLEIAGCMSIIASMTDDEFSKASKAAIGIGAFLLVLAGVMKNADKTISMASGLSFLGMAAAVYILTGIIKDLASDEIDAALIGAGVAVAAIAYLVKDMSLALHSANTSIGTSIGIVAMAASVGMLVGCIKDIANLIDEDNGNYVAGASIAVLALGVLVDSFAFVLGRMQTKIGLGTAATLLAFSLAVSTMADAVEDLAAINDETSLENAKGAATSIAILIDSFVLAAGAANEGTGNKLGAFFTEIMMAIDILAFSSFVSTYADAVSKLAGLPAEEAKTAMEQVNDALKGMEITVGVIALVTGALAIFAPAAGAAGVAVAELGVGLLMVGGGAWLFAEAVKTIVEVLTGSEVSIADAAKKITDAVTSILPEHTDEFEQGARDQMDAYIAGITGSQEGAVDAMGTVAETTAMVPVTYNDEFTAASQANLGAYTDNFTTDSSLSDAESAGESVAGKAVEGVDAKQADFAQSGQYAVDGYVNSIKSEGNLSRAYNAGSALAAVAHSGLKKGNQEGSPSKLYAQSGLFAVLGYANGFLDNLYIGEQVGEKLGSATVNSTINALKPLSDIDIESDEFQPRVVPVMDLSKIQNGYGRLNTLTASNQVLDVDYRYKSDMQTANNMRDLVTIGNSVLTELRKSGHVYLDGKTIVGYVNRGLGEA